jgi:hypothetical protein
VTDNPLVVQPHRSTTWYTGLGLVEDAAQISSGIHANSWVDDTLGGVGGSLDVLGMAIDPLGSLVAWGVSTSNPAGSTGLARRQPRRGRRARRHLAQCRRLGHQQYTDAVRAQTAGWSGRISSRPWVFVTSRLEGGGLRIGDEMTVTDGDAHTGSAVVRSIELHSAPGKTTIAVDAELAGALRDGVVLLQT